MKGNDIHSAGQTGGNVDAEEATDRFDHQAQGFHQGMRHRRKRKEYVGDMCSEKGKGVIINSSKLSDPQPGL